ncbi:MAG: hypothetical protein HN509_04305 [Halobacteriovoraceae bacterium]|jgi:hypothetical protein|nr:hypothetical protein [Halobacteriovoraceae bacterium]
MNQWIKSFKGSHHVQKENQEVSKNSLRFLTEIFNRYGASVNFEASLLENQPFFTSLLLNSLVSFNTAIFSDTLCKGFQHPLWLQLISQNQGLRTISEEQYQELRELNKALLGLDIDELTESLPISRKIKVGLYNKIELHLLPLYYQYRNDIIENRNINKFLQTFNEVEGWPKLFGVILSHRTNLSSDQLDLLLRESEKYLKTKISNQDDLKMHLQLQNGYAHHLLKLGKKEQLAELRAQTKFLAEKIENSALRSHVIGNWHYQQNIVTGIGSRDLFIGRELDYGFHDIEYRIAQNIHDKEDNSCVEYYLNALSVSTWSMPVVNDFGIALSDFNYTDQLDNLKQFLGHLGMFK